MENERRTRLLRAAKNVSLVRGSETAIYQKGRSDVPKTSSSDWLLDFRKAFLDAEIARDVSREFWDAYASRWPFQIAVVEMASVPLVGFLLSEGLDRGYRTNAVVLRKSRKKDGLCNIVEGVADTELPTVVVDDVVNSWSSLLKAALTAKNEGLRVVEFFCFCHFENPDFTKKFSDSPFEGIPLRSVFTLSDFGLERKSGGESDIASFSAATELAYGDPVPHFGLVVPKSTPLISESSLYVAGESWRVARVDLHTKLPVWSYSMEVTRYGKNVFSNVADCGNEICFWAYDGAVHFLDKESWNRRLAVSVAEWVGGTPEVDLDGDRVFVGLENGWASTWGIACVRISDGDVLWNFALGDFVHASPAYSAKNRSVYCGSNGGEIVSLDSETGQKRWGRKFAGPIKVRPTLSSDGSKIFFGCFDGKLRCLEAETGDDTWEFHTPFNVYSEALAFGQGLFIWCSDKNFYHFDWNGTLVSKTETGGRIFAKPSVFKEKYVAYGCNDGKIRFHDPKIRNTAFEIVHSERVTTSPVFDGNLAYFEDFANRVWIADLGRLTKIR